jgi:hypothetical protein
VGGSRSDNNRTTDRGNDNAAPEYALWLKGKDKSMKNASLFVGQKTPMEKLFGDKISLQHLLCCVFCVICRLAPCLQQRQLCRMNLE